jgi:hypothetical protein
VSDNTAERDAALTSKRAAYVAATADRRVLQDDRFGSDHSSALSLHEYRWFCKSVWMSEGRTEPLYVTRVEDLPISVQQREFEGAAAAARWAIPQADMVGVPRTGELAGTEGPVAYVDVKIEGLRRLFGLHEIAHLLVDSLDVAKGHGEEWAEAYMHLLSRHLCAGLSALWKVEFRWWSEKAEEKIAADPGWLADRGARSDAGG